MGGKILEFSNGAADNSGRIRQTTSAPKRQRESGRADSKIVAMPRRRRSAGGRARETEGQGLLWLITLIYLALLFVFYFGLYAALKAFSILTS